MQSPMNPINQAIGKHQKQRKLEYKVPPSVLVHVQVELGVSAYFGREPRRCEDGHLGEWVHCEGYFFADLVFEEFGVGEVCAVKDEVVREGGEDEVEDDSKHPLVKSELTHTKGK